MFKMSKNAMLFNGAALIIVAASAVMVVRSALFHDDAPPCLDRYGRGTVLNLEANGTPLGIEDLQSRAGGTDWGLLAGGRVVKLKSGPAKAAMEFNLGQAAKAVPSDAAQQRPGIGFLWSPRGLNAAGSACLAYSVFLPEDFDFGKGGILPGLTGGAIDDQGGEPKDPPFSTRIAWRTDGAGDLHTHLPGWPLGRSLGNDRGGFRLEKGRWISLEQEVVLNAPGHKNGLVRIWVDGALRFEKSGLVFRDKAAGTLETGLMGVLSEVAMPGDTPQARHKLWLTGFELRWQ